MSRSRGSDLDFVVAGGARYGMGHVMRSGTLAAAAVRRGWRVRAFLAGDRTALEIWRERCPESEVAAWSAWRARRCAPVTLFDHPFAKSRWLAACAPDRTRSVVLDDLRAVGRASLTINPALHHLQDDAPASDPPCAGPPAATGASPAKAAQRPTAAIDPAPAARAAVLSGPRYAILDDFHRASRHAPLLERSRLLLSLGGADPHRATPRLAPILGRTLALVGPACGIEARHVVLGPAFPDPEGRIARELAAGGWCVERALAPAAMAARMAEARLAVMGFGTSLCELAWHGTPHLSLTHHDGDAPFARRLEQRGIGRWLGHAARFDPAFVAGCLAEALRDPHWQTASAERARAALEGGTGCERILDRIAALAVDLPPLPARSERRRGYDPLPLV